MNGQILSYTAQYYKLQIKTKKKKIIHYKSSSFHQTLKSVAPKIGFYPTKMQKLNECNKGFGKRHVYLRELKASATRIWMKAKAL